MSQCPMSAWSIRFVSALLIVLAVRPALASMIVTYSVQPWSVSEIDSTVPDCLLSSGATASCSVASVGAYSNTLTLTPGAPQTAELFPVIVTVPENWIFAGQDGPLLPLVDFTFTDTATGAQSIFQVQVPAEYSTILSTEFSVTEQVGSPDDFLETGIGGTAGLESLTLRIDPSFSSSVTPIVGGTVTYDATAVFTTPIPTPEPASAALFAAAVLVFYAKSVATRPAGSRS